MKLNVELNTNWVLDLLDDDLITDDTMITIKFSYGQNIAYGHWFNDDILNILTSEKYKVVYFFGESSNPDGKYTERFVIEVDD